MTSATSAFGPLLRRHRLAAGLTQEDLAERAGLSVRAISDLERGLKPTPRRETIALLAQALALPVDVLEQAIERRRGPRSRPGFRLASLYPTPLIGREDDVLAVATLLRAEEPRLVTVTGAPGIGKTSMAVAVTQAVAGEFPDGVVFVPLAALRDPLLVPAALAQALGMQRAGGTPLQRVVDQLQSRRLLLLIDTFEHLLDAAPVLSQIVAACPGVKVLVTSRAALNVLAETRYELSPLALPAPDQPPALDDLAAFPAIALFAQRAQTVNPGFWLSAGNLATVVEICRRLDGLPLAIELAAARARLFGPEDLLQRLDQRLPLLTGGARDLPARHQTMRDAIAWSYDLLAPREQRLFRGLAIFSDGFSLPAAEVVGAAALDAGEGKGKGKGESVLNELTTLADQHLVRPAAADEDGPRFVILETIREFGCERLAESGEGEVISARHADYFVRLAAQGYSEEVGGQQALWFRRLERELGNLRLVARWLLEQQDADRAARLGFSLWRFWDRSHLVEGRGWLEAFLGLPGLADPGLGRCRLLFAAGRLAYRQADYAAATTRLEECLAIAQRLGDEDLTGSALTHLGHVAYARTDLDAAERYYTEGLAVRRQMNDDARTIAILIYSLGRLQRARGNFADATVLVQQALDQWRAVHDDTQTASASADLGFIALLQGHDAQAETWFRDSRNSAQVIGSDFTVAGAMIGLALAAIRLGKLSRARELLAEALRLGRAIDARQLIAQSLESFAALLAAERQAERAWKLTAAAASYRVRFGLPPNRTEQTLLDAFLAPAAAALPSDRREELWREGQQLTLDAALTEVEPGPGRR